MSAGGRPIGFDAFCGAGGCTKGYQRAGAYMVGCDIKAQPRYCGEEFIQGDALKLLADLDFMARFDFVHASPPCQIHIKGLRAVNQALGRADGHADLIGPTRELLEATGLPYVIENVPGAPLRNPIVLCGSSFGLAVRRHRLFESNVALMAMPCAHHLQREARYWTSWRPKGEKRLAKVVQVYGNAGDRSHWAEAMGIDWMTPEEMREAIPPAYTEFIGHQLMSHLKAKAAA